MTKARDLAGFASSSVTTTASDGLVLKGDGSSTDVVIKNGANATVATVADGTTNLAVVGAVTGALAQGAIQVGNSSGVAAPLTIGSSAQLLQSNGTTAAWATVSTGTADIVFPSNWASPTNNYTSSGTWSKGSLADDDYVWFYLVNSGDGGGNARPGYGGRAMLLYGTAATFNGAAYTIGAERAGQNTIGGTEQNPTTVTLSSGNGSSAFTPFNISTADDISSSPASQNNIASIEAGVSGTYLNGAPAASYAIRTLALPSGYGRWTNSNAVKGYAGEDPDCVFGGGAGYTTFNSENSYSLSLFAGNGGTGNNTAGSAPGGGGGETSNGVGASGAAGSLRVYHV